MQWVDSERHSPVVSLGLCIVLLEARARTQGVEVKSELNRGTTLRIVLLACEAKKVAA